MLIDKPRFDHRGRRIFHNVSSTKWWEWPIILVSAILIFAVLNAIPTLIQFLLKEIVAHFSDVVAESLLFATTVGLGVLLFIFKRRALKWYVVCEISVGIATALYVSNTVIHPTLRDAESAKLISVFLAWCGSLYVIVRGLENFAKYVQSKQQEEGANRAA
jgi:hypothetical protein